MKCGKCILLSCPAGYCRLIWIEEKLERDRLKLKLSNLIQQFFNPAPCCPGEKYMTLIESVISTASIFFWILKDIKGLDQKTIGFQNNNFNFSQSLYDPTQDYESISIQIQPIAPLKNSENTSLVVWGLSLTACNATLSGTPHRLLHRTTCKTQPKWPMGSGKMSKPRI